MTKHIRYPQPIQIAKQICRVAIIACALLFLMMILKNRPEDYNSFIEYALALSMPIWLILGCIYYLGAWSDITQDDDGITVEFLWKKIKVSWKEIVEVKHLGSKQFGVWIIVTDRHSLTPFHRVYSLFTAHTFSPSLHIHDQGKTHAELIHFIQRHKRAFRSKL